MPRDDIWNELKLDLHSLQRFPAVATIIFNHPRHSILEKPEVAMKFAGRLLPCLVALAAILTSQTPLRAQPSSTCVYESKTYSEGASICVHRSLMLNCSASDARLRLEDHCRPGHGPHVLAPDRFKISSKAVESEAKKCCARHPPCGGDRQMLSVQRSKILRVEEPFAAKGRKQKQHHEFAKG